MKNLILILGMVLSFHSFAQEKKVTNEQEFGFKCDTIKINSDKNILELNGNVSLKTDSIELENAEKIVFNKSTQGLVVTGLNQFVIDGAIQIKDKAKKRILRYTLGDKIAYLE